MSGMIMSVVTASKARAQLGTRTERMLSAARLAGLLALLWAVAHQHHRVLTAAASSCCC